MDKGKGKKKSHLTSINLIWSPVPMTDQKFKADSPSLSTCPFWVVLTTATMGKGDLLLGLLLKILHQGPGHYSVSDLGPTISANKLIPTEPVLCCPGSSGHSDLEFCLVMSIIQTFVYCAFSNSKGYRLTLGLTVLLETPLPKAWGD